MADATAADPRTLPHGRDLRTHEATSSHLSSKAQLDMHTRNRGLGTRYCDGMAG